MHESAPPVAPGLLRLDVVTLFPPYFEPLRQHGVCRRAFERGQAQLHCWDPRDFTQDRHRTVDDRPYGGGPGMVMLYEPLKRTLQAVQAARAHAQPAQQTPADAPVILLSPAGAPLTQARVERLALSSGAVVICGRYEGVDQRFIDRFVDEQISLGDFVLSGGEAAALALFDATLRLLPGVLHDPRSSMEESFQAGLLDHPHYSRPEVIDGLAVPPVLLGGHHEAIAQWRREQAQRLTEQRRPDLLRQSPASRERRSTKSD